MLFITTLEGLFNYKLGHAFECHTTGYPPRVSSTHDQPSRVCVYQENTGDKWDILEYTTKLCITVFYHAVENIHSRFDV